MTFTAAFNGFTFDGPGGAFNGAVTAGSVVVFDLYVDARLVAVLPDDTSLGDIDPTQTAVLPDNTSPSGIDPTQVAIIQ